MASSPTHSFPLDSGPLYAETNFLSYPVEPWNTFSLIIFLFIAGYWLVRLFGQYRRHRLLALGNIILLAGTFGGMAYHACRCSNLWFMLDVLPILLIAFLAAVFLWLKLRRLDHSLFLKSFSVLSTMAAIQVCLQFVIRTQILVCLFYVLLATSLLLPALLLEFKVLKLGKMPLFLSVGLFSIAIFFRAVDFAETTKNFLPMGTHFLWHIFGALSGHSLMVYLFRVGRIQDEQSLDQEPKNSGHG